MTHRFPKAFLPLHSLLLAAGLATVGVGCVQNPPVQYAYAYRAPDARAEAFAIEAARHHPNAQPRVRPQYPEQTPPPLAQGTSLPAPAYVTRRTQPLQLSTFDDTSPWPARSSSYSDFAPSYPYPYGYYPPAYPAYGYRLGYGVGWRSGYGSGYGYGYGPRSTSYYSSPSPHYRDFDRPHYHRYDVDHHHGEYRPSLDVPRLSAPSHESFRFQAGGRGSRPARTDVRVRR